MAQAERINKNRNWFVFFECIVACTLIFCCDTMYITLAPHDKLIRILASLLLLAGLAGMILLSGGLKNKARMRTALRYAVVIAIALIVFIIVNFYSKGSFLKIAAVFFMLLFYYFLVEGADTVPSVLLRYEQFITAIAAFSIVCWLVFSILKLLPPTEPGMTWWNGVGHNTEVTSFYGIYFEPQSKYLFGMHIPRNCGFFTEAPIASLHFCLALLTQLFLRKKINWVKLALLLAAILTTMSATGYLVAVMALIARLLLSVFRSPFYKQLQSRKKGLVIVLSAVVICAVVIVCILVVDGRVGGESWNIRLEDFRAAFKAWLQKPVFGNGLYNYDAVKAQFEGARAVSQGYSSSNSLGTILADGGMVFGVLYIGAFIMALIRAVRNRQPEMLFFSIFVFILFAVTIVPYDYIILLLFVFMGAYRCRGAEKLTT